MSRLWAWWVARTSRLEDTRPLAALRIGCAVAILLDLLQTARLGLVDVLFRPFSAGGLSAVTDTAYVLDAVLPPDLAGRLAWLVSVICFALVALGVGTRPAILLGVLAYAQLGHLYPPGDRAIDRLLRSVMLVLLFSDAHRRWTLGTRPPVWSTRGWTSDLIRTLLVVMYLSAGVSKLMTQPRWLAWSGTPVLYRVMTDPLSAHLDPVSTQGWYWLFYALGWGTIAMELSAPLIYTRWAPYWALCGIGMHLGIAVTMELGMFSWGMLALYPLLLAPWWVGWLDRRRAGAVL